MKKILVTGANSYIGVSFENYLKKWSDQYSVDTIDMIDGTWRERDFSLYDTVFHVAGIAHIKETRENADQYYQVNRDLAVETAAKAKAEGVGQFIFLSSMSVYGRDVGIITKETIPKPKSHYGKSKLQAEEALLKLQDDHFKVCILRPPMVYGKGCRGNFQSVIKIVNKFPVFPMIKNERSMIYIDNLSSFVKTCIDASCDGIYFPQNKEYVQTIDIAKTVADRLGKRRYFSHILGFAVLLLRPFVRIAQKGFGSLVYKETDDNNRSYCVVGTEESLKMSV